MDSLKNSYHRYLRYFIAKDNTSATIYDKYMALSYAVRSEMFDKWIETQKLYHEQNAKRIYLLSMDYIFGKSLRRNIVYLGIEKAIEELATEMGLPLEQLYEQEDEFELGDGEKAIDAACLMDAMATRNIAALGYGIRYDYGLYKQEICNGIQIERPYDWLHKGHPWEIIRPEYMCKVSYYGTAEIKPANNGFNICILKNTEDIFAVPYDMPVLGYRNSMANTLRLWSARAQEVFLPDYINHGDYIRACEEKARSATITQLLFPHEDVRRTSEQRLKQQYFFIAASLSDIIRRFKMHNENIADLDKKVVIILNGSCCAFAVAELQRLLIDNEGLNWDEAWNITRNVFVYISRAVARDDSDNWPVYMVNQVFPRHMQIIFEINQRNLDAFRREHGEQIDIIRDLSIIAEGEVKRIRMGNLAAIGSTAISGVTLSQSLLLRNKVMPYLSSLTADKFKNISIGICHRRWILSANQPLAELLNDFIGDKWIRNYEMFAEIQKYASDESFLTRFADIKQKAKNRLASAIQKSLQITVDPNWFFDIQSSRIHLQKRQILNLLNILYRYLRIKKGEELKPSRVYLFSGKASPSDHLGKQIIYMIHIVASIVNNDPQVSGRLKVIFIPGHNLSWDECIVAAADLVEQLATPKREASASEIIYAIINGAAAITSRCGLAAELLQKANAENILAFGSDETKLTDNFSYNPSFIFQNDSRLIEIFSLIENTIKSIPNGHSLYPLLSLIKDSDPSFIMFDFSDYVSKQDTIDKLYLETKSWLKMCVLNIANAGEFSSDAAVARYAQQVWKVPQI